MTLCAPFHCPVSLLIADWFDATQPVKITLIKPFINQNYSYQ